MALIQLNDEEAILYRAWLRYLGGESTPEKRTEAFFNAREGRSIPWS